MALLALTFLVTKLASAPAAAPLPLLPQDRFRPAIALHGFLDGPVFVVAEDFDGDGARDLIFGGRPAATGIPFERDQFLQLSLNRGGTDFALPEPLLESPRRLHGLDAADLDGDGDQDLVLLKSFDGVEVWYNDGHARFTLGETGGVASYSNITGLQVLDVDGDGILDIVLESGQGDGNLGNFEGAWVKRTGGSQLPNPTSLLTGNVRTGRTRLVDLDADGDLDVIACRVVSTQPTYDHPVAWFENTSGFPIDSSTRQPLLNNTVSVYDIAMLDVDLDGDLDLAAALRTTSGTGRTRVALNQGAGTFAPGTNNLTAALSIKLRAADVDGDGDPDLVSLDSPSFSADRGVYAQLNDGTGAFGLRERIGQNPLPVNTALVADLDGDALVDVVGLSVFPGNQPDAWSSGAHVYRNLSAIGGSGATRFSPVIDVSELYGNGPIVVADFNQDGREDLVVHRTQESPRVAVKLNNGEGRFLRAQPIAEIAPLTGTAQGGATVGDIDGDGHLDLAFVEPLGGGTSASIGAVFGDGQGQFSAVTSLAVWPADTDFVELRDLTYDGYPDLIGARAGGTQILYAQNDQRGGFGSTVTLGAPFDAPAQFEVVDVNGDSLLDVLTVAGDRVESTPGSFPGQFSPRVLIAQLPWEAASFALGDFDGDALMDLAVAESAALFFPLGSEIATYLGVAGGGLSSIPVLSSSATQADTLRTLDADGNGRDDLVAFRRAGSLLLSLFESRSDGSFAAPESIDTGNRRLGEVQVLDLEQDGDLDLMVGGETAAQLLVVLNESLTDIGSTYCAFAVPNSTGSVGAIEGYGGTEVFQQALELSVTELPASVFGFFLASQTPALVPDVPGSEGALCLGGQIGRFVGPGEIQNSGANGTFLLDVDLSAIPTPLGAASVMPGETWNFQAWHRDVNGSGQATSNFSDALRITFR
ncbi:FG-GAP repeat protein [Planctomycetes bacterium Poly30]|uniref:FG-GAP repeat protein n=1 Tax=Saltatorellus ferox TaxID=2528018 RepID=A0A518EM40_9BACT|nr:FG-GAP repeat protein [Planctomycetes bacterium Poly30]